MSKHGKGYPRYENDRIVREPYEERALRDLLQANDPDAQPRPDSPENRRRFREERRAREPQPNPIITVTPPPKQQSGPMAPPPIEQFSSFFQEVSLQPSEDDFKTIAASRTESAPLAQGFKKLSHDAVEAIPSRSTTHQTDQRRTSRNPGVSSIDAEDGERQQRRAESEATMSRPMLSEVEEMGGPDRYDMEQRRAERRHLSDSSSRGR